MKYVILGLMLLSLTACTSTPINSNTVSIQKQYPNEVKSLKHGLSIYFQPKSTEIDPQYRPALSVAAQLLQTNKNFVLNIEGHTDSSGSLAANNKVSLTRANIVKDYLVSEYKVNPDQLITLGLGPTKPIADNKTAEGKAKNRRVTVILKIK
ncbi:OmpA family protein [Acinetobacter bereziniae]|jgi:OOP family OmpA-OmpF porin|uniref:OmpA family protein n=1 Tax=Acinetobacter bereziniae TaxID=106648 RepID=A0A0A8TFP9_ACIBZ|nr:MULTISPECIES: OmpA family protein [Acinetobacter]MEC8124328.1 OmpA family protein [Pseudomonadota bacterium]ELW82046.1 OmpA family protein [Acinetobacter sp. WC-743]KKW81852.1 cell envelope biogenesis protein OmpA [Acinetobacter sp. Ag2]MBJ8424050.1 OmpA family protein [Acinetobacter bereziniae]MBJ8425039.1 OmpA family protein [Acinetobacter bereziniae]